MKAAKGHPSIGVMQGRLLPKYKGRYQAHPVDIWPNEFEIARRLNLSLIEFILDYDEVERNPLRTSQGRKVISQTSYASGIGVKTVCADYFMEAPLHSMDRNVQVASVGILEDLILHCPSLGITDIVIPCVDHSTLPDKQSRARFISALQESEIVHENVHVRLAIESDLGPQEFGELLDRISLPNIAVNYDIGNSASLGYDFEEEFEVYGHLISDVHIKDRLLGEGSVELGSGNAKIEEVLLNLEENDYPGVYIMQAFRDDEGLAVFKKQLNFVRNIFSQIYEQERVND